MVWFSKHNNVLNDEHESLYTPITPDHTIGSLRLVSIWSDKTASWYYSLEKYTIEFLYGGEGFYYWLSVGEGDRKWSDRIAEHYKDEELFKNNLSKKRGRPVGSKNKSTKKGKK